MNILSDFHTAERLKDIEDTLGVIRTHMRFVIEALPEDKQEEVVRKMLDHATTPPGGEKTNE